MNEKRFGDDVGSFIELFMLLSVLSHGSKLDYLAKIVVNRRQIPNSENFALKWNVKSKV